jgi:hypothetical protein
MEFLGKIISGNQGTHERNCVQFGKRANEICRMNALVFQKFGVASALRCLKQLG